MSSVETRRAITTADTLITEARAALAVSPMRSDALAEEAWLVLQEAGRHLVRGPALVAAWVRLARFVLHELGPAALAHGPHIGDDAVRADWYRDSKAFVYSVLAGLRTLRARGLLVPGDFDEMNDEEEHHFLAGLEEMTRAAVA